MSSLFRGTLRKGMFSLLLEISRRGGGGELARRGAKARGRERGFSAPRGGREGAEAEGGSLPLPSPSPTYTPARLLALLPPPPDSHCVAPNRVSKRLPPASPACCNAPPSLCRMSGGIMLQEEGEKKNFPFSGLIKRVLLFPFLLRYFLSPCSPLSSFLLLLHFLSSAMQIAFSPHSLPSSFSLFSACRNCRKFPFFPPPSLPASPSN